MSKKILVIEDEDVIANLLQDELELMGYEVILATSGIEGLGRAESMKPDIITLDIMMPGLDGIQVLRELKSKDSTKDIPVVIISIAERAQREEGLRLGALAFLKKPVDFSLLNEKIKSITEKKRIMVLEDNADILKLLEVRLSHMGYEVISMSDGSAVVSMAKKTKPDIILMDVVLPDGDSFKIISAIKEDKEIMNIPVISFSGFFADDIGDKKIAGVDKFIGKDFSVEDLAKEVDEFVKSK